MEGCTDCFTTISTSCLENDETLVFELKDEDGYGRMHRSSGMFIDTILDPIHGDHFLKFPARNSIDFSIELQKRVPPHTVFLLNCTNPDAFQHVLRTIQSSQDADRFAPLVALPQLMCDNESYTWTWTAPADCSPIGLSGLPNYVYFISYSEHEKRFRVLARFRFFVCSEVIETPTISPMPPFSSSELLCTSPLSPGSPSSLNSELLPSSGHQLQRLPSTASQKPSTKLVHSATIVLPDDPEDSPGFRSILRELGRKTECFRGDVKKLLKRIQELSEAFEFIAGALGRFMESVLTASATCPAAFQPLVETYVAPSLQHQIRLFKSTCSDLIHYVFEPLERIYVNDLKLATVKRIEFEEFSKNYYTSLSRYLANKTTDMAKDESKYLVKKKDFELRRFDYYCYIQDLHDGPKTQDILAIFTSYFYQQHEKWVHSSESIDSLHAQLDGVRNGLADLTLGLNDLSKKRESRRRKIILETTVESPIREKTNEKPIKQSFPPGGLGLYRHQSVGAASNLSDKSSLYTPSSPAKDGNAIIKEGLLLALSKPTSHTEVSMVGKTSWHKYWVVLQRGKLAEYVNWKQKSLSLHNEPISLAYACVKKAESTDRRFCFEVITPKFKRVYQATSESELHSWMRVLQETIKANILSGVNQERTEFVSKGRPRGMRPVSMFSESIQQHPKSRKSPAAVLRKAFSGRKNSSWGFREIFRPEPERIPSMNLEKLHESSKIFISMLCKSDPENLHCADCGSSSDVTWCAINYPVILCIECSGIHRSLGTHISKVRSLLLDSLSQQLKQLLCKVGNTNVNAVWEARVHESDLKKPSSRSASIDKQAFIKKKYSERGFLDIGNVDAKAQLVEGIRTNNIRMILTALAAKPNFSRDSCDFLAVIKPDTSQLYLLELLLANGLVIPPESKLTGLVSPEVQAFIRLKRPSGQ
ncbi:centaurin ADOP ribosylation factor GTPase activating protein family [Schizosaccharomyces japonicus yFS275]|uniref:ADP-ribosylation factor GTPase-activating protein n=1 Tax=Schizosaccharomyces japonicus (strain yFS275 / FY16936) TaxID=402676 RepID=B6K213_SCHJY|nr:centaurin ADOP ribosylation factor GTPase activating protein family [Schizosaccharomyces japonicus yFS275]EEB07194.1 centaurin ADOP ribosylation factor GTPase activating protein family [Schizosaccharomyces japonicus yFS275]